MNDPRQKLRNNIFSEYEDETSVIDSPLKQESSATAIVLLWTTLVTSNSSDTAIHQLLQRKLRISKDNYCDQRSRDWIDKQTHVTLVSPRTERGIFLFVASNVEWIARRRQSSKLQGDRIGKLDKPNLVTNVDRSMWSGLCRFRYARTKTIFITTTRVRRGEAILRSDFEWDLIESSYRGSQCSTGMKLWDTHAHTQGWSPLPSYGSVSNYIDFFFENRNCISLSKIIAKPQKFEFVPFLSKGKGVH